MRNSITEWFSQSKHLLWEIRDLTVNSVRTFTLRNSKTRWFTQSKHLLWEIRLLSDQSENLLCKFRDPSDSVNHKKIRDMSASARDTHTNHCRIIASLVWSVKKYVSLSLQVSLLLSKNVWKSDKSWEPEKIWKIENLKKIQNSKIKMA